MIDDPTLADAARRLARDYGLDLAAIGSTVLGTALAELRAQPAAESGLDTPAVAVAALFNALPVGLSWIDRDVAQLRSAASWAAVQQRPLRVLSAPCARGEEVWSLAGALLDAGVAPASVQILGVDAMPAAIAQAERGDYPLAAVAGRRDPPWWLTAQGDRWVVHPRLRPMARFRVVNLLDPAAAELGEFDLILSRNFLIYLTPEARDRWCALLGRLLSPGGRLYTAVGEPIAAWSPAYAAVAGEVAGAWSPAPPAGRVLSPTPPAMLAAHAVPPRRRSGVVAGDRPSRPAEARAANGAVRAAATAERAPARTPAPPGPDPRALADAGELAAAEALLAPRLAVAVPAAGDLVTAGLLALARGRPGVAEDAFRRALFLDHHQTEAAALLAALLDQRGEVFEADRLRRRAGGER